MPRNIKSQWDFGELFPPQQIYQVITVTEFTQRVRRLLEKEIGQVWVTGEITNLRAQSSGHLYFTLKDANAQVSCVLFRGETVAHRDLIQDGQKVVLQGDLTVYDIRGQYQLIVRNVDLQGLGALQVAFEKLKQKLQAEGLFAKERKKPIPRYPLRIGLVTSPTGAAIRDILHVIQRRHAGLELLLASCRVQGGGAAEEIACAIELLNHWNASNPDQKVDLILLTRGGGSMEDLWSFNEERVARAIYNSATPVVSAVGHEIDFTISDFVADFRAATPSAAAELITEGYVACRAFLADTAQDLSRRMRQCFQNTRDGLRQLSARLLRVHPGRQLQAKLQYLDDLQSLLIRNVKQGQRDQRTSWTTLRQRLWRMKPSFLVLQRRQSITPLARRLQENADRNLKQTQQAVGNLKARLRLLSPANVLNRGYSITADANSGRIIRAADEVRAGQRLTTQLKSGQISSTAD